MNEVNTSVFAWDENEQPALPKCAWNRLLKMWWKKCQNHVQLALPCCQYHREVCRLYRQTLREDSKELREVMTDLHKLISDYRATGKVLITEYFVYKHQYKGADIDAYAYLNDRGPWQNVIDEWTWANSGAWFSKKHPLHVYEEDKEYMWQKFNEYGIATTRRFGIIQPGKTGLVVVGETATEHPPTALPDLLQREKKLFCKPADGQQGKGCMLLEMKNGTITINGTESEAGALHNAAYTGLMVEQVLQQHPAIAALHPASINTVRIATMRASNGEPTVIAKCLRIGRGNSATDNWSSGGLVVGICGNGRLKKFGYTNDPGNPGVLRHPDTGIVLEGYDLPYYREATELVLRAHRCFGDIFSVGWDVAITPAGPVIVEGNIRYGIKTLQQADGGLRWACEERLKPAALALAQKDVRVFRKLKMR